MPKALYIFDLDETLINGDSSMLWNQFIFEHQLVKSDNFLNEDRRLMGLYAKGIMSIEEYLTFSLAPLSTIPVEQVDRLAEQCIMERILPRLYPEAEKLIQRLGDQQQDMLVISATVAFLVNRIAEKMGITYSMGIDLKQFHGCYSHEIDGIATYQEGKVLRLKQWLHNHNDHYDEIHFYTDSINDLPLCEHADFAYLVNPSEKLTALANRPNWQTLNWT